MGFGDTRGGGVGSIRDNFPDLIDLDPNPSDITVPSDPQPMPMPLPTPPNDRPPQKMLCQCHSQRHRIHQLHLQAIR